MPFVVVEREHPIAVVRINRPEVRNALNAAVMDELAAALETLDRDATIGAIVLTGDEKAFAAGADIGGFVEATPISMQREGLTERWERIARVGTPLIAAVSGYALGGGCELAMVCDIIVASETAQFGQPEINLGVIPGAGGTQRLTRVAGKYRAMELVLTGRRFGAAEAKELGLVARVFPKDTWLEDAKALAREIASKPPLAVRAALEAIDLVADSTLSAGLEFERKVFYMLFASDDKTEGARAFLEKRKPNFKGR